MSNTPRKKYSTIENLRKLALQTGAYIANIKQENDHIGKGLAVIVYEVGRIRKESEGLSEIGMLKVVVEQVERISRASHGISLLLEEWQRKITE